jgi:hypothetical protein
MKQKWLAIGIILLFVGVTIAPTINFQVVKASQQNLIKERINQRELLFQTIVDIANNKEIQRIILKSQMSRGIFPTSEIPVVTKNQIRQMYFHGFILSKVTDKSRLSSLIKKYQTIPSLDLQTQIKVIIEKDTKLDGEISQLSILYCQCENQNTKNQVPLLICGILFILLCVAGFFAIIFSVPGLLLLKISEYLQNAVVDILMLFYGFIPIFWFVVVCIIGAVMFVLGCLGPNYPPLDYYHLR